LCLSITRPSPTNILSTIPGNFFLRDYYILSVVQAVRQIKTHVYANRSTESERWQLHPHDGSPPGPQKSPDYLAQGSFAGPHPPLRRSGTCARRVTDSRSGRYYGADPIQSSPPAPEGQHSPAVKQPFFFLGLITARPCPAIRPISSLSFSTIFMRGHYK
jgi:hypothetical protein